MLARIQQALLLALLAAVIACQVYLGDRYPWLAAGVAALLPLGLGGVLALEFVLLTVVNRGDTAPQPTYKQLARAWWGEILAAVRAFGWRQPFRSQALPDQLPLAGVVTGQRGVVFIHGLLCNRGLWNPWLARLQDSSHAFIALSLEPVLGSIDDYVPAIDAAVTRMTLATGLSPLVVCHSMGGLAARAWLKTMRAEQRVHRIVTIGTPHAGTWLARFGYGDNSQQMRLLSDWQTQLAHGMLPDSNALFVCWYSSCDNIVFPTTNATLPGADNRFVPGAAHVQLAFEAQVMDGTLALL